MPTPIDSLPQGTGSKPGNAAEIAAAQTILKFVNDHQTQLQDENGYLSLSNIKRLEKAPSDTPQDKKVLSFLDTNFSELAKISKPYETPKHGSNVALPSLALDDLQTVSQKYEQQQIKLNVDNENYLQHGNGGDFFRPLLLGELGGMIGAAGGFVGMGVGAAIGVGLGIYSDFVNPATAVQGFYEQKRTLSEKMLSKF
jgi:hypothetical protein